ncbi:MAG: tyrosine--tRNA ligase [Oligoflexales bacterium]
MTDFIELMEAREMVAQISHREELQKHMKEQPRSAYIGFDPTAPSLTAGHLLPLMALKRWKQSGHKVVVLLGGGTGRIGDPSGKTEMRQLLDDAKVQEHIACQTAQFLRVLQLGEGQGQFVNNSEWLSGLNFLEFMREVGSHFPVSKMLAAEAFKARLGSGLTFFEMGYMLLQAYDFRELNRQYDLTVQMGGDDQWSNMLAGVDLIRRMDQKQSFVLTVPLLTTSDGRKMGKTEKGTVWLDPELTSPWDFYQYWRNVEDEVVRKCLLWLTDLSLETVEDLTKEGGATLNKAKESLAEAVTSFVHGAEIASDLAKKARELFSKKDGESAPEFTVSVTSGVLLDLLVEAKLVPSKGEGRRLVQQGGIHLDGEKQTDPNSQVNLTERGVVVRKGKKTFVRLMPPT